MADNYTDYGLEEGIQAEAIKRALALQTLGESEDRGRMIGNIYVPAPRARMLARGLQTGAGMLQQQQAEAQTRALRGQQAAQAQELMRQYNTPTPDTVNQLPEGIAGPPQITPPSPLDESKRRMGVGMQLSMLPMASKIGQDIVKSEVDFPERQALAQAKAAEVAAEAARKREYDERMMTMFKLTGAQQQANAEADRASREGIAKIIADAKDHKDPELARLKLEKLEAEIANLRAKSPEGKLTGSLAESQKGAKTALFAAGYDPATGEDNVTGYIKGATGSGLGAAVDTAAGFFGKTTKGAANTGKLEAIAKQITIDRLNGKLGGGISNADIVVLDKALGDIANASTPTTRKLEAWNEAKRILVHTAYGTDIAKGGATVPTTPQGGGGQGTFTAPPTQAPAGTVDMSTWSPEKRAKYEDWKRSKGQ